MPDASISHTFLSSGLSAIFGVVSPRASPASLLIRPAVRPVAQQAGLAQSTHPGTLRQATCGCKVSFRRHKLLVRTRARVPQRAQLDAAKLMLECYEHVMFFLHSLFPPRIVFFFSRSSSRRPQLCTPIEARRNAVQFRDLSFSACSRIAIVSRMPEFATCHRPLVTFPLWLPLVFYFPRCRLARPIRSYGFTCNVLRFVFGAI